MTDLEQGRQNALTAFALTEATIRHDDDALDAILNGFTDSREVAGVIMHLAILAGIELDMAYDGEDGALQELAARRQSVIGL
jgi:hypothetical protein